MKSLPIHNQQFETYYTDFARYIKTKGYGRGKCSYASHAREFLFFIESCGINRIQEVTAINIIAYHDYLKERPNQRTEGGLCDSVIKSHLFALRLFFDHLLDLEIVDSCPARLPKFQLNKSKERIPLTIEEIKILYAQCETKRDIALISIAYGCGLRRGELHKLNTNDVLLHKGMLIVRDGKGGKSRVVPMSDVIVRNLKDYIIYERPKYLLKSHFRENNAFFINGVGTRMYDNNLNGRLKELVRKANNPEMDSKQITLHHLRHSIATHLLDNGATIEFVQKFLGHSQIDTSHLYSKRRKRQTSILQQFG
jgi:integrase/recombinase XerD